MNVFQLICHRKPERSFFLRGYQFPVCARCTGFYLSLIIYFIYTFYFPVHYTYSLIFLAIIFLIPAMLDGLSQFKEYRESNNGLRLITGLIGGLGLGILVKALKYYIYLKMNGGV